MKRLPEVTREEARSRLRRPRGATRYMNHYRGEESVRRRCWVTAPGPPPPQHQEPGAPAKAPTPGCAQNRLLSWSLLLLLPERSFPPRATPPSLPQLPGQQTVLADPWRNQAGLWGPMMATSADPT